MEEHLESNEVCPHCGGNVIRVSKNLDKYATETGWVCVWQQFSMCEFCLNTLFKQDFIREGGEVK